MQSDSACHRAEEAVEAAKLRKKIAQELSFPLDFATYQRQIAQPLLVLGKTKELLAGLQHVLLLHAHPLLTSASGHGGSGFSE